MREAHKIAFRTTAADTAAVLRRITAHLKEENYSALAPDLVAFKKLSARLSEILAPFGTGHEIPAKTGEKLV